jgi:UDP-2-acetamido-2,6-beta-L-arabino-hexul-4-ose reductase
MTTKSGNGFDVIATERRVDARGALAELVRDIPGGAQLYVFTIEPGQTRGGHWHGRKHEWFACVAGEALLVLEHVGNAASEEVLLDGNFSRVVHVRPQTRHMFSSPRGATIVACISESFDPTDPDTFFPPAPGQL